MATKTRKKKIRTLDQANSDFNDFLSRSKKTSGKKKTKRTK